jgi:predicted PurR-regulated permease PerM
VENWLLTLSLSEEVIDYLVSSALNAAPGAASGVAAFFSSSFSSVIAFLIGVFLVAVLLFYLLSDWHTIEVWVARHLSVPEDLGLVLVADATMVIRRYYYALTLSSIVVSVSVGLTMVLLDLPLGITVALVTMITSYIPYLGAILSGAFAFLISLGAGGLGDALVVLAVVLLMQNVIQTIIQTKLASDRLRMHPLVTFISTVVGGALFGLLGATLGTPITAIVLTTQRRVQEYRREQSVTSHDGALLQEELRT